MSHQVRGLHAAGTGYPLATHEEMDGVAARWPGLVRAEVADVRDREALQRIVAGVVAEHGGLDVAVAAAAVLAGGWPLWETPPELLDHMWATNVQGVWNLAVVSVPAMLARAEPRHGRFVAIASAAAHRGVWHLAAYST